MPVVIKMLQTCYQFKG